jgi:uncharacterized sulfatase
MYEGFQFEDNPGFHDDLHDKPLLQRLWAGERLHASPEELNGPSRYLSLFLGCNSFVDMEIGRVIEQIDKVSPGALVFFTSDHGAMINSHRLNNKDAAVYKEIVNIPLIIKGGEKGSIIDSPVSHVDIAPTIMEYMDLPVPEIFEGRSLMPAISGVQKEINDTVFIEFTRYEVDHDGFGGLQMMRAAVNKRYKLAINLLDIDEFYDTEKDPWEVTNLINDKAYESIRNKLHDELLENMNRTRDPYRGYQWAVRPWRKDKQPLWEIDGCTRQRKTEKDEPWQLDYDTGLPIKDAVRYKDLS